jgi:two-component system, chemotaxis family, chemotaxis protein CheY
VSLLDGPVLVVDDSHVVRTVIRDHLERLGAAEVVLAATAQEALQRYEAHRPRIILLDITMPEVPGTRVAHHILRQDPHAKVVIMTAMSRDADLVESAISGGAYEYLRKPVRQSDLAALFARIRSEEAALPARWGEGRSPQSGVMGKMSS